MEIGGAGVTGGTLAVGGAEESGMVGGAPAIGVVGGMVETFGMESPVSGLGVNIVAAGEDVTV